MSGRVAIRIMAGLMMGFIKFAARGPSALEESLKEVKEYHGGYDYKNFWQNGWETYEAGAFFYRAVLKSVRNSLAVKPGLVKWFMRYAISNRLI
jgi:hypothetical protein